MMFTFLENALNLSIFTQATSPLPLVKTLPPLLIITSPTEDTGELLIFTRQHFFENLFLPAAGRGGKDHDLLYQNSGRKYEDDLENYVLITITNYDL